MSTGFVSMLLYKVSKINTLFLNSTQCLIIFSLAVVLLCCCTYFIHKYNLILADLRAGVVVKQSSSLEVLALHALPFKNTSKDNLVKLR